MAAAAALRGGAVGGFQKHQQQYHSHSQIATGGQLSNTCFLTLSRHHAILPWSTNATMRSSCPSWPLMAVGTTKAENSDTQMAEPFVSYELLRQKLASGQWESADEETRRLLIVLAGESAIKRNYIFFSEVQFIPASDLKAIDDLWRSHSNGRFGYSVQRRIWNKVNRDFTEFFKKVGWMKLLQESEIEQYTYRSFPREFMWEFGDSTPEGHLPLTNALRGTQLLSSILQHPAFDFVEEEDTLKVGGIIENILDTKQSRGSVNYMPEYKI